LSIVEKDDNFSSLYFSTNITNQIIFLTLIPEKFITISLGSPRTPREDPWWGLFHPRAMAPGPWGLP